MKDDSEIINYNDLSIPIYLKTNKLSYYPDKKAICHWHDDIEIIMILDGEMNYYINGKHILLTKDSCIIINSKQMHYGYSNNDSDCTFLVLLFHPSLLCANKELYKKYVLPIIDNENLEYTFLKEKTEDNEILSLIKDILGIYAEFDNCCFINILGHINIMWAKLYKKLHGNISLQNKDNSDVIIQKKMVSYIYKNYSSKITLADIAASGNVCRSKCCKIFNKYLMQSPIDFLNTYRLELSKNMLTSTDKSITEIALNCGFNHLSYFSEMFQREYKCTPSEYKANK